MLSYCFIPLISRPTRVTEHTASLIDNILTNAIDLLESDRTKSGIVFNDISDHYPIFHVIKSKLTKNRSQVTFYKDVINEYTVNKLKSEIRGLDWSEVTNCNDVNIGLDKFNDKLFAFYKKCILVKKICVKPNHKPWITKGLLNSIKHKNKLYVRYLKNPCDYTRNRYKCFRNKLTHLLRISEQKYVRDFLAKYSSNLKKSWGLINDIINKKKNSSKLPKFITTESGVTIDDQKAIADYFNEYFTNIGPTLSNQIQGTGFDPIDYMGAPSLVSMFLKPVHKNELREAFNQPKKSSSGYDNIKPIVLQSLKDEILCPINHLVTLSFKHGIFPDRLKIACITPIFKQGQTHNVENYRPVSVLCSLSKIFERIMCKRLLNFVESSNILYSNQYGFRKGYSTELALLKLQDDILKSLDDRKHVVGVFMDLLKHLIQSIMKFFFES